jgi:hypothetical protein
MSARAILSVAVRKVGASVEPRQFERRGLKFVRRAEDGFVSLIELQPSRKSTPEKLLFVINFGVIVPSLFVGDDLANPEYGQCHWGGRVSNKEGVEIWWPVRADDDAEQLAARLAAVVKEQVLPGLDAKQREEDLIALWKTGRSPLLVDSQRLLFLGTLLHGAGKTEEFEQTKAELERKAVDSFALRALDKLKGLAG